jgi:hypothetical protein
MSRCGISDAGERGGVLLTALVVTLLVTMAVLYGAYETSLRLRSRKESGDARLAGLVAQAGVERGARLAHETADWRSVLGTGSWILDARLGGVRFDVEAEDPTDGMVGISGPLGSSSADTVRLKCAATAAGISRARLADFLPIPHPALRCVAFSDSTISIGPVSAHGRIRGNADVNDLGGAIVRGDIATVSGSSVSPSLDDADTDVFYDPARAAPPDVDFGWFRDAGEEIVLPIDHRLVSQVITSTRNPFGLPSPRGIYWIDAAGGDVRLGNVHIEACVAILNANDVVIDMLVGKTYYAHASPDPARLPALVVEGNLEMHIDGGTTSFLSLDLSPVTVESRLQGVFYCTGSFAGPQVGGTEPIEADGAFISGGRMTLQGPGSVLRHVPALNVTPLAEFEGDALRLIAGTTREP